MKTIATKKNISRLLCLGTALLSVQAFAAPPGFITNQGQAKSVRTDNAGYWTRERMMHAKPAPVPTMTGAPEDMLMLNQDGKSGQGDGESETVDGMEGDSASVLLSGDEADAMAMAGAIDLQAGDIETLSHVPPHVTGYVPLSYYPYHPWRTIGKVFFSSGPYNYVCSGSSVGGRAVLTAGHCVSNGGGGWYSNWRFAPRYMNGSSPDGIWSASFLSTFTAWHTTANLCRDVGFAITNNQGGLKLSQKVGYLGFAWNYSQYQNFNMFGYPAAYPWNGQYMVHTQASTAQLASPNGCTPYVKGIGTTQTGGTSGGPWLLNYAPFTVGNVNHANGVNSFIYTAHPNVLYSPHFDTAVNNLRTWAVAQ